MLVTLLLVGYLLTRLELPSIVTVLKHSNKKLLVIAMLVLWVSHPVAAYRWKLVLQMLGYRVDFWKIFIAYLTNLPITKFTPAYSGDFLRALHLKKEVPMSKNAGVVFLEGLADVGILALSAGAGALFLHSLPILSLGVGVLGGLFTLGVLVRITSVRTLLRRVTWGENFMEALHFVSLNPTRLIIISILTFGMWLPTVLFVQIAFSALGTHIALPLVFGIQPIVAFLALIPFTVSGVGVRESGMLVLYAGTATAETIFSVGLLYSFFSVIVLPFLCLPLVLRALNGWSLKPRV